jgi:hypothetical protein
VIVLNILFLRIKQKQYCLTCRETKQESKMIYEGTREELIYKHNRTTELNEKHKRKTSNFTPLLVCLHECSRQMFVLLFLVSSTHWRPGNAAYHPSLSLVFRLLLFPFRFKHSIYFLPFRLLFSFTFLFCGF